MKDATEWKEMGLVMQSQRSSSYYDPLLIAEADEYGQ